MNRIRFLSTRFIAAIVLTFVAAVGCSTAPDASKQPRGRELVNRIQAGMSRADVVALLGTPVSSDGNGALWNVPADGFSMKVRVRFDPKGRVYQVSSYGTRETWSMQQSSDKGLWNPQSFEKRDLPTPEEASSSTILWDSKPTAQDTPEPRS